MYYFATPHVNTNVKENTLDFEKVITLSTGPLFINIVSPHEIVYVP